MLSFAVAASCASYVGPPASQRSSRRAAVRCSAPTEVPMAPPVAAVSEKEVWVGQTLGLATEAPYPAIATLREAAVDAARSAKLPGRKDEAWRRTDLSALFATSLVAPSGEEPSAALLDEYLDEDAAGMRLVFVDGLFSAELSDTSALPAGVTAGSLSGCGEALQAQALGQLQALPEADADPRRALGCYTLAAINQASLSDVACVHVPAEATVDRPLHVVMLSRGPEGGAIGTGGEATASHPNLLVMLERDAQLELVQHYVGEGVYFANGLSRFALGEGSKLVHHYVQEQAEAAVHVDSVCVAAQSASRYEMRAVQMGGKLARVNLDVQLQGPHASCDVRGLALASARQLSDVHSTIAHVSRDCESAQEQRNAVADTARAIFKGAIFVARGADNTTANQLCRSLLLNDRARVDIMPCLEIFTDDVQCTHGATVADLDDEMVFYLQSRGLDRVGARTLLLQGWAREVMNQIPSVGARRRAVAKAAELSPESEERRLRQQTSSRKLGSI